MLDKNCEFKSSLAGIPNSSARTAKASSVGANTVQGPGPETKPGPRPGPGLGRGPVPGTDYED